MEEGTPYFEAKVLLAAIILVEHRDKKQAEISALAELTRFSVEMVHHLVNKLEGLGAVRRISGPFEDRVAIVDESAIEPLVDQKHSSDIEDEVSAFASKQKAKQEQIQNLFSSGDPKKDEMRATLEDQLKVGGKVKKENPLDALTGGGKKKLESEES